jgi:osomolarity two-component system phosphorelay intermediate protein YPD1
MTAVPLDETLIDRGVFEQVLEMDEDTERSFSHSLVQDFTEQAEETFTKMRAQLYVACPITT